MSIVTRPGKIRILLLIDQIYSATGGSEQHVSFLLRSLPSDRIELHLAVLRDAGYRSATHFPVDFNVFNFQSYLSPGSFLSCLRELSRTVHQRQIDVIYSFFPDSELIGSLVSRITQSCILVAGRRNMGHWIRPWHSPILRFKSQFIAHFIANCHAVKRQMIAKEKISPSKIKVIYNPLPIARTDVGSPHPSDFSYLGIDAGSDIVGIVANLRPIKDQETIIQAARIVLQKYPQARFLLVGDAEPEYKRSLESLISSLGLGAYVRITGEIANPIPLMNHFRIGVLCSKSEGLSNALIEYAASGLPVVATDVGGNSEVVVHGITGFVVPPSAPEPLAKAILQLLEDEKLRRRFGANGRRHAEIHFAEDTIISTYRNYFTEIVTS